MKNVFPKWFIWCFLRDWNCASSTSNFDCHEKIFLCIEKLLVVGNNVLDKSLMEKRSQLDWYQRKNEVHQLVNVNTTMEYFVSKHSGLENHNIEKAFMERLQSLPVSKNWKEKLFSIQCTLFRSLSKINGFVMKIKIQNVMHNLRRRFLNLMILPFYGVCRL